MSVVAIVNQKGGVGKTTITLGLASAAARRGARVLVVDLDPQANATSGLGVWEPTSTVDQALAADQPGSARRLALAAGWPPVGDGPVPDVVASSPALAAREPQLATDPVGAQDRLELALEGHGYDLVLIDCPPSLGLLTVNGLFAADRALVVTEPAAWASDGVAQIRRTISRIAARRGGLPSLAGIAVNRLGRTRDARYWHEQLVEQYGDDVMAPVHLRAAVTEASAQSLPIHALGPRAGAPEAAAELDALLLAVVPELAPHTPSAAEPEPEPESAAPSAAEPASETAAPAVAVEASDATSVGGTEPPPTASSADRAAPPAPTGPTVPGGAESAGDVQEPSEATAPPAPAGHADGGAGAAFGSGSGAIPQGVAPERPAADPFAPGTSTPTAVPAPPGPSTVTPAARPWSTLP